MTEEQFEHGIEIAVVLTLLAIIFLMLYILPNCYA